MANQVEASCALTTKAELEEVPIDAQQLRLEIVLSSCRGIRVKVLWEVVETEVRRCLLEWERGESLGVED
jgi:hypothetical protein